MLGTVSMCLLRISARLSTNALLLSWVNGKSEMLKCVLVWKCPEATMKRIIQHTWHCYHLSETLEILQQDILELLLLKQTPRHHLQLHDHVGQSHRDLQLQEVEWFLLRVLWWLVQQTLDWERSRILDKINILGWHLNYFQQQHLTSMTWAFLSHLLIKWRNSHLACHVVQLIHGGSVHHFVKLHSRPGDVGAQGPELLMVMMMMMVMMVCHW